MHVGLVARADDRGIGSMTWEFHKALRPERVLVVREPGAESKGFAPVVERYADAPSLLVTRFDPIMGVLHEDDCRDFLDGLDVVYLVETPYDVRFYRWAREAGVATVLHVMPEFWRGHEQSDRPDVWWLPTSWRAGLLPSECRLVEVPVPENPRLLGLPTDPERVVLVHVVGHRTVADRNGTLTLLQALRTMRSKCTVRLYSQDRLPAVRSTTNVTIDVRAAVADRWSMYDDADVLVLPRRFGGLCLPALEAMASGLAVVMPNVEPQVSSWPVVPLTASLGRTVTMPCGDVKLADVAPRELARALDRLVGDPELIDGWAHASLDFAREHSWRKLRPVYDAELHRAIIVASTRRA